MHAESKPLVVASDIREIRQSTLEAPTPKGLTSLRSRPPTGVADGGGLESTRVDSLALSFTPAAVSSVKKRLRLGSQG